LSERRPGGLREEDNCESCHACSGATANCHRTEQERALALNKERERKKVLEKEGQEGEERKIVAAPKCYCRQGGVLTHNMGVFVAKSDEVLPLPSSFI